MTAEPDRAAEADLLNSDQPDRDVSRDQQIEGAIDDREERGTMLTDDDPQPDQAAGTGGGYRESPDIPDIGEPGSPGSDQP